jgi:hypothetical protein
MITRTYRSCTLYVLDQDGNRAVRVIHGAQRVYLSNRFKLKESIDLRQLLARSSLHIYPYFWINDRTAFLTFSGDLLLSAGCHACFPVISGKHR